MEFNALPSKALTLTFCGASLPSHAAVAMSRMAPTGRHRPFALADNPGPPTLGIESLVAER